MSVKVLKPPVIWLIVKQLIQANSKQNIKTPLYWPFEKVMVIGGQ